jgi:putative DNA primase/helicase
MGIEKASKVIREEKLLKAIVLKEIKLKVHQLSEKDQKAIIETMDTIDSGLLYEYVSKKFSSEFQSKVNSKWDSLIAKEQKSIEKERKKEEQIQKKKDEKKKYDTKITDVCEPWLIRDMLLQNQKDKATEIMTQGFLKKEKVYTTRSDDKSEMWIYREGIYIPEGRTFVKEFVRDMCGAGFTTNLCNQVLNKIEADTYIEEEKFFISEDPKYILVENGMLNLITKEICDFDPERFFFNKLPIYFNPGKEVHTIKEFFETVLHPEDVNTMQEIFGYLLYRDYKFEKAFMFMGTGRNGKGKSVELMKRFLGTKNCANVNLQRIERDNFALSELHNKMANLSADISHTALNETGDFKSLTGHDLITAPRKFRTAISFVNYAKMIFCANELPRTSDITVAFFNRWILIDFPYTFIDEMEFSQLIDKSTFRIADKEIIEKISTDDELSGLLNWALEGLSRLMDKKQFSSSKTTEETKTTWLRKSDSLTAFCLDYIEEDWSSFIPKPDFLRHYSLYCRQNKIRMITQHRIKNILMQTYGADEHKQTIGDNRIMVWQGIKFKKSIIQELNRFDSLSKDNDSNNLLIDSDNKLEKYKSDTKTSSVEGVEGVHLFPKSCRSNNEPLRSKKAGQGGQAGHLTLSEGKNVTTKERVLQKIAKNCSTATNKTMLEIKFDYLISSGDILKIGKNQYLIPPESQIFSDREGEK